MLSMARLWSKLRISGTFAMVACLVFSSPDAAVAAGETPVPPPPPATPGAKPSKDRFSKAMKRLREQRRNKAQREKAKAKAKRAASKKPAAKADERKREPSKPGGRVDLSLKPELPHRKPEAARKDKERKEKETDKPAAPKIRRPAPPLPAPKYTELEQQLQRNLSLHVTDLGPDERWQVSLANRGPSTVEIVADPRLLSFDAHVPGKTKPVTCKLPDALQPKPQHIRRHALSPGEQYTFTIDPLMYCFESGEQTILVPGTFLTPAYGFTEKTQTRWSWGRRYEERLEQEAPFVASPVRQPPGPRPSRDGNDSAGNHLEALTDDPDAPVSPSRGDRTASQADDSARPDDDSTAGELAPPDAQMSRERKGLKRVAGDGFALRSEYQGWAQARVRRHDRPLEDWPQAGLRLSITSGTDAVTARDVAVTVRLENLSDKPRRVYFRRDLVSFRIKGPDGEHECESLSAEYRAPDPQGFTTIGAGKSVSFTTQLLELCPTDSFGRAGFYYVSAMLPATAPGGEDEVFTGRLVASKPRPVRLHQAELPFTVRRGPTRGGTQSSGRFTRSPNAIVPDGEMIQPLPAAEPPPPPPVEAPAPAE